MPRGRVRMRLGEQPECNAEAKPGDCIYVSSFMRHQVINASDSNLWNAC